jgi:hypothetical protein
MALTAVPDHSVGDLKPLFGSACLYLIEALGELAAGELAAVHGKLAQADHALCVLIAAGTEDAAGLSGALDLLQGDFRAVAALQTTAQRRTAGALIGHALTLAAGAAVRHDRPWRRFSEVA